MPTARDQDCFLKSANCLSNACKPCNQLLRLVPCWLFHVQDVAAVLAAEYPQGVDVVYEGVGGQLRAAIMQHLAPNARVLQVTQGLCHTLQLAYKPANTRHTRVWCQGV